MSLGERKSRERASNGRDFNSTTVSNFFSNHKRAIPFVSPINVIVTVFVHRDLYLSPVVHANFVCGC